MPKEISLSEIQPCPKCHNEYPAYALGYDGDIGFYVRCRKCNKYVFTHEDISVARRELLRLCGKTD